MHLCQIENPSPIRLSTGAGELLQITVEAEAHELEPLLDALARLPFPVNPQIHHPVEAGAPLKVEFPAYASQIGAARDAVQRACSGTLSRRAGSDRASGG